GRVTMRRLWVRMAAWSIRCGTAAMVILFFIAGMAAPRAGWGTTPISFRPPIYLDWPASGEIIAADFDGDGKLDLAVVGSAYTTILYGKGDGHFEPREDIDLPMTSGSMQAIAADVNGDGLPDLVVAYGEDGQARGKVVVLINRGHR